jgi:hypothetical protein
VLIILPFSVIFMLYLHRQQHEKGDLQASSAKYSMPSSARGATILYLLLSPPSSSSSSSTQSSGFLSPERIERKSSMMNDGSMSTLFPPNSKFHPNQNGLSKRRRWLVVDFDGTCTEHDTTPLLPRLAAFATRTRSSMSKSAVGAGKDDATNNEGYNHQQDLQKRLDQFQLLEDDFMKRYGEARSNMFSNDDDDDDDDSSTTLYDVLDALDEPSTIVTGMVSASRCLSGLGHADTEEVEEMLNLHGLSETHNARESTTLENESNREDHSDDRVVVRLRHGCESTLTRILLDDKASSNDDTHACIGWSLAILSINWCPALIDAAVVQPVLRKRRSLLRISDACDTEVPIWSNEVDIDGVVTLHVPGALAKRDRILELRRHIKQEDCDETQKSMIIYVGDSSTDLAALLVADVGIVMGNSSSLIKIAESWGVEIAPLKDRNEHGFQNLARNDTSEGSAEKKILWQVDTWQEIDEALQEIDEQWQT